MSLENLGEKMGLLVVTGLLSYFSSPLAGQIYEDFIGGTSSLIDARALIGLPIAFIFFSMLLFSAFGGNGKYWWVGVLLVLPAAFVFYFDVEHIYFYVAVALAGLLLGQGIRYLLIQSKLIK